MKIKLNNQNINIKNRITIKELLVSQGANIAISLVAINDEVISQDQFEFHIIQENDIIDIMKFASGG